MPSRGPASPGGLTLMDVVKIALVLVAIVVVIRVFAAIVGAVLSVVGTILVGVAVLVALWVVWSLVFGGKRDR
ncbi:hypothetical protein [Patulibacter sp. SYSU D01012]|uniref:hypothetical protein n=1 Tax=Patulibacter sp. SYSU D01012 TaxID=2817381 RepID=UPI001B318731|nr:hypothetical protein [Patulibacter sp. SYSU D01012]